MDDLPHDMEGLNNLPQEIKERTIENHGRRSSEDEDLEQKRNRQGKL
jgi:hypothetical protein